MTEQIRQTLRYLSFSDCTIAGVFFHREDQSFVFVGFGDEESIVLEFSPAGTLEFHRKSDGHGVAENAIEDLECDPLFEWIGF